jgi:uncharacterized Rmd1/YagE family protein
MYHLPLLPGYGPNTSIRSSVVPKSKSGKSIHSRLSEAEEMGYQGTYFTSEDNRYPRDSPQDGYISSSSPVETRKPMRPIPVGNPEPELESAVEPNFESHDREPRGEQPKGERRDSDDVAEVVFFDYGVVVFFGLAEGQERAILDDLDRAGVFKRKIKEQDWEVEECHFAVGPYCEVCAACADRQ